MGRIIPYIMENKNVPNHQPDNQSTKVFLISSTRKLGQPDDELKTVITSIIGYRLSHISG
jgi:hypothetical protein